MRKTKHATIFFTWLKNQDKWQRIFNQVNADKEFPKSKNIFTVFKYIVLNYENEAIVKKLSVIAKEYILYSKSFKDRDWEMHREGSLKRYTEYIHSHDWSSKKVDRLLICKGKCETTDCENEALQLHHKNYIRLGNERMNDITYLCKECHERKHGTKFKEIKLECDHCYYISYRNVISLNNQTIPPLYKLYLLTKNEMKWYEREEIGLTKKEYSGFAQVGYWDLAVPSQSENSWIITQKGIDFIEDKININKYVERWKKSNHTTKKLDQINKLMGPTMFFEELISQDDIEKIEKEFKLKLGK